MLICNKANECDYGMCFHEEPHAHIDYCDAPRDGYVGCQFPDSKCIGREDKMTTLYEINTRNSTPRMETWWECYVEGTDGGNHYHHLTLQGAKTEAERLARLTDKPVYIFECVGKCKSDIKWETPVLW